MGKRQIRWETMDKDGISFATLTNHYLITCATEGKTPSTLRGYREKLNRFVRWIEGETLADFGVPLIREYTRYLQAAPKYDGHPFHEGDGEHMSASTLRNHLTVLKSFSTWLYDEEFTDNNLLARLKLPKAARKIMQTLSDKEITRLYSFMDQKVSTGCRNRAMLTLLLDTGLRSGEILTANVNDLHIDGRWLLVMGKGQKQRVVPFGASTSRLLQRYLDYFRPESVADDFLFLQDDGMSMTYSTLKMVFARLSVKAKIPRLHIHLLRHTFATRYLLDGGDAFMLQRILGHSTLEMTRRYVDMVVMETAIKERRPSTMDHFFAASR